MDSFIVETKLLPSPITEKNYENKIIKEPTVSNELATSFSEVLKKLFSTTNSLQLESEEMTRKFVLGEVNNVHEVMLAIQKAETALEFTMEIINQLVRAYSTLERMQ